MDRKKLLSERKKTAKLAVTNEAGEVEIIDLAFSHRPITPALADEFDAIEAASDVERVCKQLLLMLTGWGLSEDGAAVELSEANLRTLDSHHLYAIIAAILEPLRPK